MSEKSSSPASNFIGFVQPKLKSKVASRKAMNGMYDEMGKRFCQFRNSLNMSQQELADKLGVHQNMIFRLEHGVHLSGRSLMGIIFLLTKHYRLNPAWLLAPDNQGGAMTIKPGQTDSVQKVKLKLMTDSYILSLQKEGLL